MTWCRPSLCQLTVVMCINTVGLTRGAVCPSPWLAAAAAAAGASQHALAAETSDQVAEALLDINTLAPIRLTQAVLPHMLKR